MLTDTATADIDAALVSEAFMHDPYPLMRRMQSEGLVATYLEESPSGPPRKYYRITEIGRDRLAAQVAEWRAFASAVDGVIDPVSAADQGEARHDA